MLRSKFALTRFQTRMNACHRRALRVFAVIPRTATRARVFPATKVQNVNKVCIQRTIHMSCGSDLVFLEIHHVPHAAAARLMRLAQKKT